MGGGEDSNIHSMVWGEERTARKCHSTQAPLGNAGTLRKVRGQLEHPARGQLEHPARHCEEENSLNRDLSFVGVQVPEIIVVLINCGI